MNARAHDVVVIGAEAGEAGADDHDVVRAAGVGAAAHAPAVRPGSSNASASSS